MRLDDRRKVESFNLRTLPARWRYGSARQSFAMTISPKRPSTTRLTASGPALLSVARR
jgi:hypothetical protein